MIIALRQEIMEKQNPIKGYSPKKKKNGVLQQGTMPHIKNKKTHDDDGATEVQTNFVSSQYFTTITTKSKIIIAAVVVVVVVLVAGKKEF